jgi:hypothetical protein
VQQLPEVLIFYFYFYVHFRAAIIVVDGGDIFGIWKAGEEIWVRFFWAKGYDFYFFHGGGEGEGVRVGF